MVRQLGVSDTQARLLLREFHKAYPGIRRLRTRVSDRLRDKGYLRTLYGRIIIPESDHKAVNAIIQGSAADIIKRAMIRVHSFLSVYESHLILTIHDEIGIDTKKEEEGIILTNVPMLMKDPLVSEFLPVEVSIAKSETSWAFKEQL